MKIYTRTGDRGETGLFGGGRVRKDHVRVDAYGEVDELNSVLGVVVAQLETEGEGEIARQLRQIQADLFAIGAHLATPHTEEGGRASTHIPDLPGERIAEMERWIDSAEGELEPLRAFILPGGTQAAALLHLARTVCRRAERRVVSLAHEAQVEQETLIYLNRLSDLLFILARLANRRAAVNDIPWMGREKGSGNEVE